MKKKMMSVLVLMAAVFVCCDNSDSDNGFNIIKPIDVTDGPVADFFNAELPDSRYSESFFYAPDLYGGSPIVENFFYVINSRQELADIYLGNKELPEIDFDKYTLIVGQQIMPFLGFYVAKKEIVKSDDGMVFNLYARHDVKEDGAVALALQELSFWALFPKLTQKSISFNVIREFPNRTTIP